MGYFDAAISEKENHLEHHGVKGQRWGVRRYQNYDGTRIGASKSKTKSKKKTHDFQDNSASDMSKRSDTVNSIIATTGMTAISSAAFAASVGLGQPVIAAYIGTLGAASAGAALRLTGRLIKGDIESAVANKKEKKFAEERAQNTIDKKTGFHKKTTEMTPEEDMERVNPAYKNWDQNTKNNCVLCTMSMELRRRGYDVQANKATDGYDADTLVKDWFVGAKTKTSAGGFSDQDIIDAYTQGNYSPSLNGKQRKEMISNTVNEVLSQGDGARGQIALTWNGQLSGHSVYYANEENTFVIYDTQANKKFSGKTAEAYLWRTSQNTVTRLDNCDINMKYIKEVAS